jgi:hypothetical protein
MTDWQPIETAPEHIEVWTKIDDERGARNEAQLTRHGRLWYTHPINGMYVYYTPTHWRKG